MTGIRLQRLRKEYGDVVAANDVNLDVEQGEFLTILGPSGSGKTTLLSLIAGLTQPTAGHIMIAGRDVAHEPPQTRNIGLVFQSYALFPHMTVAQNIGFPLTVRRWTRARIATAVGEALALIQLDGLADRKPAQLSGGQQQRVALARAIVFQPDILLLDEPLGALDRKLREELQVELRQLQRRLGITTLLVTHDQEEALSLSDRIMVLDKGRVQQLATPEKAYLRPANRFVAEFLGTANMVATADGGLGVVRPERIQLAPAGTPGDVEGTVREAIYLGQSIRYHVITASGGSLVCTAPFTGVRFDIGAAVTLRWAAADIWPLPWSSLPGPETLPTPQHPVIEQKDHSMERRTFNKLLAAGAASAAFGHVLPSVAAEVREVRMIEAGGKSGESIEAAYIRPFTEKTGIKVVRESPNDIGKLRALVESGSTAISLFEVGSSGLEQAKSLGLLQKLDWAKIAPLTIFPEAKNDYGMGYQYFSTLMAWRKGAKAPTNWADFFNAEDFPGKRTLPDDPVYVLPMVLLAAGVPMDKLYPLDVDLAFRTLDKVKKDVSVWWKAGAQPPQLLRDNEVQYAISYSGRVTAQEGIEYTFKGANLDLAYFCVVKGTSPAQAEAAYKLLYEMTVPKNQAVAAEVIAYTGNSPDLEALLPKDKLPQFPTVAANKNGQFFNDAAWWFKNGDATQKRWQDFILNL